MFDIDKVVKRSKLSQKEINEIKREIRKEFPNDRMMYELHLIRVFSPYKARS